MFSVNVAINDGDFTKTIYSLVSKVGWRVHKHLHKWYNFYTQIKEGALDKAIKVLHGIPESNSSREGLSLLGYCYFQIQDFHNAANCYEQLKQMFPDNDDYKLYHAQALSQACMYDEAYKITNSIENVDYKNQVSTRSINYLCSLRLRAS